VIAAFEMGHLELVPCRIALQARDPLLKTAAKARTDLITIFETGIGIENHGTHLSLPRKFRKSPAKLSYEIAQVFPVIADTSEEPKCAPDYAIAIARAFFSNGCVRKQVISSFTVARSEHLTTAN